MVIKYNVKHFFCAIIVLFLILYIGIALIQCRSWNIAEVKWSEDVLWLRNVSYTLTAETLLAFIFIKWLWKFKIFKFLVHKPCLSGKWTGYLEYDYNDEHQKKKTEIYIKQDFFRTIIILKTDESESISVAAQFDIDEDRGLRRLFYNYQNEPKPEFRDRSPIHYGTVRLNISDDNKKLEGEYWTSRKSVGTISLKRKHK